MKRLTITAGTFVAAVLFLNVGAAQAAVICTGCEYIGPAGTHIGTYNPAAGDTGTYQNTGVTVMAPSSTTAGSSMIASGGSGSVSADFTDGFGFTGFTGGLYAAGAPVTCTAGAPPQGCTAATLGALIQGDTDLSPARVATGVINIGRWCVYFPV